jgi:hypothetical protein
MKKDFKKSQQEVLTDITRRHFLYNLSTGIGAIALGSLAGCNGLFKEEKIKKALIAANPQDARLAHFAPKAKRVIFCIWLGLLRS